MSETEASSGDPIAQIVDLLRPRILGWKKIIGRGDWAACFPADDGIAFGLVTAGCCDLRREDSEPVSLSWGDYLLMPKPRPWELRHGEGRGHLIEDLPLTFPGLVELGHGDAAPTTTILGGYVGVDRANADLLAGMLEPVVVLPASATGRLATLLDLIDEESSSGRAAASPVLDRLLEIMLIEALRFDPAYPGDTRGGLRAGGRAGGGAGARRAIHTQPGRAWTVATRASGGGLSRSLFAERFERRVGTTPISYLLRWRMALARRALSGGARTTEVARAVGYGSAGAFSAAFARVVGLSPDAYRRAEAAGQAAPSPDLDAR